MPKGNGGGKSGAGMGKGDRRESARKGWVTRKAGRAGKKSRETAGAGKAGIGTRISSTPRGKAAGGASGAISSGIASVGGGIIGAGLRGIADLRKPKGKGKGK